MAAASTHQWKNVVVGLGKGGNPKLAGFFSCILDQLTTKGNSAHVVCELANNVFSISAVSDCHSGHFNLTQAETLTTKNVLVDGHAIGPVILEVNGAMLSCFGYPTMKISHMVLVLLFSFFCLQGSKACFWLFILSFHIVYGFSGTSVH